MLTCSFTTQNIVTAGDLGTKDQRTQGPKDFLYIAKCQLGTLLIQVSEWYDTYEEYFLAMDWLHGHHGWLMGKRTF